MRHGLKLSNPPGYFGQIATCKRSTEKDIERARMQWVKKSLQASGRYDFTKDMVLPTAKVFVDRQTTPPKNRRELANRRPYSNSVESVQTTALALLVFTRRLKKKEGNADILKEEPILVCTILGMEEHSELPRLRPWAPVPPASSSSGARGNTGTRVAAYSRDLKERPGSWRNNVKLGQMVGSAWKNLTTPECARGVGQTRSTPSASEEKNKRNIP